MKLEPGEAVVLIIRRSETNPARYFVAVRQSTSSIDPQSNDFQLHGGQESVLELGNEPKFPVAMEKAIAAIREVEL